MKQRVIVAKPPVYDRCVEVFGVDVIVGKPILWSWGDVIYNPLDVDIPRELYAHEAVHGVRQCALTPETWWAKYLTDPAFRFEEERVAHRAEWLSLAKWGRGTGKRLHQIAERLASPLYGSLVSPAAARDGLLSA